jgi:hypothetical protein
MNELTYVLIQTTAKPAKVATAEDGNGAEEGEKVIVWENSTIGDGDDMWVVKSVENKFFFCDSEVNAEAVKGVLGDGAEWTKYPECAVNFKVNLNHIEDAPKNGVIARNEFIHLNLTGVKGGNVFGGIPKDKDPGDGGDDPIVKEDAYLTFDVTVAEWLYDDVQVELQ